VNRVPVLDMKEIKALAENLRFVVGLDAQALSGVKFPKTLFQTREELILDFGVHHLWTSVCGSLGECRSVHPQPAPANCHMSSHIQRNRHSKMPLGYLAIDGSPCNGPCCAKAEARSSDVADGTLRKEWLDALLQWDIRTGTVIVFNISRVTPPSIPSFRRECP